MPGARAVTTIRLPALALALIVQSASAAAVDQRPPLKGVSAIRVSNYGAPSVMVEAREQVASVVGELNQPSYSLAINQTDMPRLSKLLTEIPPAKCK